MAVNTNIVVLSRTLMSGGVCVGALDVVNDKMLRLLDDKAHKLLPDAPYQVGQCYAIKYAQHYNIRAPHTEDAAVYEFNYLDDLEENDFDELISSLCNDNLSLEELFDGKLLWDGSAHMEPGDTTDYSVQIATLDCDLTKSGDYFESFSWGAPTKRIKYVGARPLADLPNKLTAGTRIRFSLARFWDKDKDGNLRAYLQLSGIYE
jgi:hypothetical protein